jgi:hypothetical protein
LELEQYAIMLAARLAQSVVGRRLLSSAAGESARIHVCTLDTTAIITLTSPRTRNGECGKEVTLPASGIACADCGRPGQEF